MSGFKTLTSTELLDVDGGGLTVAAVIIGAGKVAAAGVAIYGAGRAVGTFIGNIRHR